MTTTAQMKRATKWADLGALAWVEFVGGEWCVVALDLTQTSRKAAMEHRSTVSTHGQDKAAAASVAAARHAALAG